MAMLSMYWLWMKRKNRVEGQACFKDQLCCSPSDQSMELAGTVCS